MKLTVVGCSGSYYDEVSPCSAYLISGSNGSNVLLDCGLGTRRAFVSMLGDAQLDALVLTHSHADHCGDLQYFLAAAKWRDGPCVFASHHTRNTIEATQDVALGDDVWQAADSGPVSLHDFNLEFMPTIHSVPTLAVRVSDGPRSVVYCSDTGPNWSAPDELVGADIAIVECTLTARTSAASPFHLDPTETALLIDRLAPGLAIVTHIPPHLDDEELLASVMSVTDRNVVLAKQGIHHDVVAAARG